MAILSSETLSILYEAVGVPGIGDITFDASINEVHNESSEVTTHSVEEGCDIADHVILSSPTLEIEVFVTNTPIRLTKALQEKGITEVKREFTWKANPSISFLPSAGLLGGAVNAIASVAGADVHRGFARGFEPAFDRVIDVYNELSGIVQAKKPVTIATSIKTYPNMILENLSVPKSSETGDAISFNVSARQIRTVSTAVVPSPQPKIERGKKKKELGKVPTTTLETTTTQESLLHQLFPNLFS